MARHLFLVLLVLSLGACDSGVDPVGVDGGDTDAGRADGGGADGGAVDGGAVDAAGTDASAMDAGEPTDGATPEDAGPDATPADGGPTSMPCMATGACDPFVASSCPSGQKCRVTDTGTECQDMTMDPPLGLGDVCLRDQDCGPTLWCVSFGAEFVCRPMCPAGSIGDCGPDAACTGAIGTETCVQVCRDIPLRCNIFTQDCADSSDMCTLTTNPETRENYTGCRPEGTLTVDQRCGGALGRCVRGLICISEVGVSTCRQVCGPAGMPPTCATGACTGLSRSWGVPYCH